MDKIQISSAYVLEEKSVSSAYALEKQQPIHIFVRCTVLSITPHIFVTAVCVWSGEYFVQMTTTILNVSIYSCNTSPIHK